MAARKGDLMAPGNANLRIGDFRAANREIGVPKKPFKEGDDGD
jgi:hypothetical protein